MWLSIPSTESITRPRLAIAIVSAVAAASVAYYAYQNRTSQPLELPPGPGLHRSNAVRRRRHRRNDDGSSSSSEAAGDENVDIDTVRPLGDAETTVDTGDDWWNEPTSFPNQRAGHNIVNLLFRVSEDNARRNGCVHRGCQCNSCGMVPIRGVRYRCANCADFDLCETCEAQGVHIKTHIFYKIRVPAPPFGPRQMQAVWYTGDPDTCRRNLPRGLILKLSRDTGFERPELEAFWEQWTFMANTEWRDDPDELGIAMDRKTFERCLVPTGGSRHAAPNLIHDRMFSFYDSNRDDLIGFTEFLHGLSYRKRKGKLLKVFEGYDIDEDGYVDRRDFLRMFRAYYVLYKQMHKDILDGLEDQLLASTEAQQLINSRQPLSSLFGREGRVPSGDSTLRHEGKTYHPDGRVEITDNHESVVVEDRGDTARREDILTSLFACETDRRSQRRLIARNDNENNWRTVHRLSGNTERTYLVTLLDPPSRLDQLPGLFEIEEPRDHGNETETESDYDDSDLYLDTRDYPDTDSEVREAYVTRVREKAPKIEKRKKEMARDKLHDRWRRRQFYLDEEEGGVAPEDWEYEEDILENFRQTGESSKSAAESSFPHASGSSSRVRFTEELNGKANGKEPETNGTEPYRDMRPRWAGGWSLPNAERDAGKEILYQVTQQAFNELLDIIFKPSEDLAMEAAETREQRHKYKHLLDKIECKEEKRKESRKSPSAETERTKVQWIEEKTLDELLSESGYRVEPRNGDAGALVPEIRNGISRDPETLRRLVGEQEPETEETDDPTLPQFRPDTSTDFDDSLVWYPITNPGLAKHSKKKVTIEVESEPSPETLQHWKRLSVAESHADQRGGWGKLNFEEFETIYKSQEHQGNRLDYLGSWIDFCIP